MNAKISASIEKIRKSTERLLGDDITKYNQYQHIVPTGDVKTAWQGVCKHLVDTLDELQKEDE